MNLATPELREMALRLLANGVGAGKDVHLATAAQFCGRLGPVLAKLAGTAGSLSLFARALALATQEAPRLKALKLKSDGQLHGFEESVTEQEQDGWNEAGIVLVAQLLGLLHAFIGERLTMQLVDEAWPAAPPNTQAHRNIEP